MDFTDKCLSKIGRTEFDSIKKSSTLKILPSFYMLNVLKIDNETLMKGYSSDSENERLSVLETFVNDKTPSRVLIKIAKESSFFRNFLYIFMFFGLVVLYFCKTN